MYICGKCKSTGLYRDDDRLNNISFLVCLICGNRWPGGEEPVKVREGTDFKSVPESETQENMEERDMNKDKQKKSKYLKVCAHCGDLKRHQGRGLCGKCYKIAERAGTLPPLLINRPPGTGAVGIPASLSAIPTETGAQEETLTKFVHPKWGVLHGEITLLFYEDDKWIYENILAEAKRYRRDPIQHIFWILQQSHPREE